MNLKVHNMTVDLITINLYRLRKLITINLNRLRKYIKIVDKVSNWKMRNQVGAISL